MVLSMGSVSNVLGQSRNNRTGNSLQYHWIEFKQMVLNCLSSIILHPINNIHKAAD